MTSSTYPIPIATYRLQFNKDFKFSHATELLAYLKDLGVSHCYASPYLKARPGSMHGYDITDHNAINPEIGDIEDFNNFVSALKHLGLGQILDMVPNHMGIMGRDNDWWLDVLENGHASIYADFFDIDWRPVNAELNEKVLVPILGDHYGNVLEKGELKLSFDETNGEFSLFYYDHRFPIDPREYPQILDFGKDKDTGDENRLILDNITAGELEDLCRSFKTLPSRSEITAEARLSRHKNKQVYKEHLSALYQRSSTLKKYIDSILSIFNGVADNDSRFDSLHNLIKCQAFRLAYWRVAADDINYRRFFDINDLAALRMEEPAVFNKTHRFVLDLLVSHKVDGLRIDHPDGLYDPLQYFQRLHKAVYDATRTSQEAPFSEDKQYFYLTIEKIIAGYEHLPKSWPIAGTTGYRFTNVLNGIFVDTTNQQRMSRIYSSFINEKIDFQELVYRSKKLILRVSLASQLNVLANQLSKIALSSRHTCDFTFNSLRDALKEILACFPIYRTYITKKEVSDDDIKYIDWAVRCAKKKSSAADITVFDFARDVLTTKISDNKLDYYRDSVYSFAMHFQQLSSPVMAKAVEDTSFYNYHRLISLNEVGGDPNTFGITMNAFHGASIDRAKNWPHTMLASSTHDGKRSEDVRARINVLSEMPALWKLHLSKWKRFNKRKKIISDGQPYPTLNDEYLLYQTLIGAWPLEPLDEDGLKIFSERIKQYMLKAAREAKTNTSWINPNAIYENALNEFIDSLLFGAKRNLFLDDFLPFKKTIAHLGMLNSLSQTLVKLSSPGVPDIYQGNELWDFSLVDPDNRRPVDYEKRRSLLKELKQLSSEHTSFQEYSKVLFDNIESGRLKLYITWKTLSIRRQIELLFRDGDYVALKAGGEKADHLCTYARIHNDQIAVIVAPRFFYGLLNERNPIPIGKDIWKDTYIELPVNHKSQWINVFTNDRITSTDLSGTNSIFIAELFSHFPFALVVFEEALVLQ